jgi:hypothetical protein
VNPSYPRVAARAGHLCEYCRAPELIFNFPFEVEHIIPSSVDEAGPVPVMTMGRSLHKRATDRTSGQMPNEVWWKPVRRSKGCRKK